MNKSNEKDGSYRDKVSTVDKDGKRVWIFPKKPIGSLYKARVWVSYLLLSILFIGPFIKVDGNQWLLLNLIERKFIIFGVVFWPQDFHLFLFASLTFVVFIVLFTVIFGRIWCGWACPQTIFMEMVFRKIEYLIEGTSAQQKALKKAPWTLPKIFKKTLKHVVFLVFSFAIGHALLAYIIGVDGVRKIVTHSPSEHFTGFIAMVLFNLFLYWVYAFFREQICTLVCPYGRLQGVLLDQNSIIVSYDYLRGEPRGKLDRKKSEEHKGDCIDCSICVDVCPTGIDIRNGTQLECINCTACIDACNGVMETINKPHGLIRYDSSNGIKTGEKLKFSGRIAGYSLVLALLIVILSFLLLTRDAVEVNILRTPGTLFVESNDGIILNYYNIEIVNKSFEDISIGLDLMSPIGSISKKNILIQKNNLMKTTLTIDIPLEKIRMAYTPLKIKITLDGEIIEDINTMFLAPANKLKKTKK